MEYFSQNFKFERIAIKKVSDPGSYLVQRLPDPDDPDSEGSQFPEFLSTIQLHFTNSYQKPLDLGEIKIGQQVIVHIPETQMWSRGLVKNEFAGPEIYVELVDEGTHLLTKPYHIYEMEPWMFKFPYQAKTFKLLALHPCTLSFQSLAQTGEGHGFVRSSEWDLRASKTVKELGKRCKAARMKVCLESPLNNRLDGFLFFQVEDDSWVCLNHLLVEQNQAVFDEPEAKKIVGPLSAPCLQKRSIVSSGCSPPHGLTPASRTLSDTTSPHLTTASQKKISSTPAYKSPPTQAHTIKSYQDLPPPFVAEKELMSVNTSFSDLPPGIQNMLRSELAALPEKEFPAERHNASSSLSSSSRLSSKKEILQQKLGKISQSSVLSQNETDDLPGSMESLSSLHSRLSASSSSLSSQASTSVSKRELLRQKFRNLSATATGVVAPASEKESQVSDERLPKENGVLHSQHSDSRSSLDSFSTRTSKKDSLHQKLKSLTSRQNVPTGGLSQQGSAPSNHQPVGKSSGNTSNSGPHSQKREDMKTDSSRYSSSASSVKERNVSATKPLQEDEALHSRHSSSRSSLESLATTVSKKESLHQKLKSLSSISQQGTNQHKLSEDLSNNNSSNTPSTKEDHRKNREAKTILSTQSNSHSTDALMTRNMRNKKPNYNEGDTQRNSVQQPRGKRHSQESYSKPEVNGVGKSSGDSDSGPASSKEELTPAEKPSFPSQESFSKPPLKKNLALQKLKKAKISSSLIATQTPTATVENVLPVKLQQHKMVSSPEAIDQPPIKALAEKIPVAKVPKDIMSEKLFQEGLSNMPQVAAPTLSKRETLKNRLSSLSQNVGRQEGTTVCNSAPLASAKDSSNSDEKQKDLTSLKTNPKPQTAQRGPLLPTPPISTVLPQAMSIVMNSLGYSQNTISTPFVAGGQGGNQTKEYNPPSKNQNKNKRNSNSARSKSSKNKTQSPQDNQHAGDKMEMANPEEANNILQNEVSENCSTIPDGNAPRQSPKISGHHINQDGGTINNTELNVEILNGETTKVTAIHDNKANVTKDYVANYNVIAKDKNVIAEKDNQGVCDLANHNEVKREQGKCVQESSRPVVLSATQSSWEKKAIPAIEMKLSLLPNSPPSQELIKASLKLSRSFQDPKDHTLSESYSKLMEENFSSSHLSNEQKFSFGQNTNVLSFGINTRSVFDLGDLHFDSAIIQRLMALKLRAPSSLQTLLWPAVDELADNFVVGPGTCGKTLGYMVPLVSQLCSRENSYSLLPQGYGPIVLVLAASWKKVERINQQLHILLKNQDKVKFISHYWGKFTDNSHKVFWENGYDIAVMTPDVFLAELDSHDCRKELLWRASHLVLDGADSLVDHYPQEIWKILKVFKVAMEERKKENAANGPNQVISLADRWHPKLQPLLQNMTTPYIFFTSYTESLLYKPLPFHVHMCVTGSSRFPALLDILRKNEARKRIICTTSVQSALVLESQLKTESLLVTLVHEEMKHYHFKEILENCQRRDGGSENIIVVTEAILPTIKFFSAECLIHYDLPATWSQYGQRLLLLRDGIVASKTNISIHTLVCHDEDLQASVSLVRFLRRMGQPIPPELLAMAQQHLWVMRSQRPLCHLLKGFGRCPGQEGCRLRHSILTHLDSPNVSGVKIGQEVKLVVTHVIHATHFLARLYDTDNSFANMELSLALQEHFSQDPGEPLSDINIGDILAWEREDMDYVRVEVLSVNEEDLMTMVRLIDEGVDTNVPLSKLRALPTELREKPPQAFDVLCCNIQPRDPFLNWTLSANNLVNKHLSADRVVCGKVALCLGTTLWLNPFIYDPAIGMGANLYSLLLNQGLGIPNPSHMSNLRSLCADRILLLESEPMKKTETCLISNAFLEGEGKSQSVLMSYFESPQYFYVQRLQFHSCLQQLEQEMNKLVESGYKERPEHVVPGTVGMICCSDEKWYRVRVEEDLAEDVVEVWMGDYGSYSEVSKSKILSLPTAQTLLPFQAIPCSLYGLEPDSWDQSSKEETLALFTCEDGSCRPLIAKVVEKSDLDYAVILCDTTDPQLDLSLAHAMVENGLATWDPTTDLQIPNLLSTQIPHQELPEDEDEEEEEMSEEIEELSELSEDDAHQDEEPTCPELPEAKQEETPQEQPTCKKGGFFTNLMLHFFPKKEDLEATLKTEKVSEEIKSSSNSSKELSSSGISSMTSACSSPTKDLNTPIQSSTEEEPTQSREVPAKEFMEECIIDPYQHLPKLENSLWQIQGTWRQTMTHVMVDLELPQRFLLGEWRLEAQSRTISLYTERTRLCLHLRYAIWHTEVEMTLNVLKTHLVLPKVQEVVWETLEDPTCGEQNTGIKFNLEHLVEDEEEFWKEYQEEEAPSLPPSSFSLGEADSSVPVLPIDDSSSCDEDSSDDFKDELEDDKITEEVTPLQKAITTQDPFGDSFAV